MKIQKYAAGYGLTPVYYNPTSSVLTRSAEATTASAKSSSDEEGMVEDLWKEVFKANGLQSDHKVLMNYINSLGSGILTSGFGPQITTLKMTAILSYMNDMKAAKEDYKAATDHLRSIKGEYDTAISSAGGVFVIRDNKLQHINPMELNYGEQALTNAEVANIRGTDPTAAFNDFLMTTISLATSMAEIRTIMRDAVTGLQSNTSDLQYYVDPSSYDSLDRANKAGILHTLLGMNISVNDLLNMDADTLIELKVKNTNNATQLQSALFSIDSQLSLNQRILLELKAKDAGIKDGYRGMLLYYLNSYAKGEYTTELDTMDRNSGTRGKNKTASEEDSLDKLKFNEGILLITGMGANKIINIHEGTLAQITGVGTQGILTTKLGEALGKGSADTILTSSLAASLDTNNITFGGVKIDSNGLSYMMLNDSNVIGIDLPYDLNRFYNEGIIVPDVGLAKKVQQIEIQIKENNITDPNQINALYAKSGLPVKFSGLDSNGNPILNIQYYRRFIAAKVTADQQASEISFSDNTLLKPVDEHSIDAQLLLKTILDKLGDEAGLTTHWGINKLWFGPDEIYNGVLYIPLIENALNAYLGADDITIGQAKVIEANEQQKERLVSAGNRHQKGNHTDWNLNYGTER